MEEENARLREQLRAVAATALEWRSRALALGDEASSDASSEEDEPWDGATAARAQAEMMATRRSIPHPGSHGYAQPKARIRESAMPAEYRQP